MLVEHCRNRVDWLARRLIADFARVERHEQPSDVAQEALLNLWQALRTTQPDSERHLLLLAGKKVREALHDLARRHGRQRHGQGNLESQGDVAAEMHAALAAPAQAPGPMTLDQWTVFHDAIERLPEPERQVMLLKWFAGANEEEIIRVLGSSRSTVQRLWASAKGRINEALGREPPP